MVSVTDLSLLWGAQSPRHSPPCALWIKECHHECHVPSLPSAKTPCCQHFSSSPPIALSCSSSSLDSSSPVGYLITSSGISLVVACVASAPPIAYYCSSSSSSSSSSSPSSFSSLIKCFTCCGLRCHEDSLLPALRSSHRSFLLLPSPPPLDTPCCQHFSYCSFLLLRAPPPPHLWSNT